MSEYPTPIITVRHECGELMLLRWFDEKTPQFCTMKAYFDQAAPINPTIKCSCGKEIVPFRSKEWSEQ